jgi:4'-phosphopantetheinyl transferase
VLNVASPLIEWRDVAAPAGSAPRLVWPAGPSGELRVTEDEVHVWAVQLDRDASVIREMATLLDDDERDRASRFRRRVDRDRFIVAHAVLRRVLARYLRKPAQSLRFRRDRFGKPSLAHRTDVTFNMAHADSVALIAVTTGRPVGVDVERVTPLDDAFDVAEICFAPAERRVLHAVPAGQVSDAFFNCWTRKEAFIKAVGTGLSAPLKAFEVSLEPDTPARLCRVSGSARVAASWTMAALHPAPGYVGALALRRRNVRVTTWQIGISSLPGRRP